MDIDENSVRIAAENALKNNISKDRYTALAGNIVTDSELVQRIATGYDVVCANIVADVLLAMSGLFAGFIKQDGKLVISGIIEPRKDEVLRAVQANGFELE